MATTFAVLRPGFTIEKDEGNDEAFIEVAYRAGGSYWRNELAPLLPDSLQVYAIDNRCRDIKTIGDLKRLIDKEDAPEEL